MKERLENPLVLLLLLLACGAGLAWLHSDLIGYQRTWSDSRRQVCGRLASLRGRIVVQRCNLAPLPVPKAMLSWRVVIPADFVVGASPSGERVIVTCAGIPVPFAYPQTGGIGFQARSSASAGNGTRWSASWVEATIPYWLLVLLLVLGPVEVGARRLVQRIKQGR